MPTGGTTTGVAPFGQGVVSGMASAGVVHPGHEAVAGGALEPG